MANSSQIYFGYTPIEIMMRALWTSWMIGLSAITYLTTFESLFPWVHLLLLAAIIWQSIRHNVPVIHVCIIITTFLISTTPSARLATYLDNSFKIMDLLVLMIVLSHSSYGFAIGISCSRLWRRFCFRLRKRSSYIRAILDWACKVPFLRVVVPVPRVKPLGKVDKWVDNANTHITQCRVVEPGVLMEYLVQFRPGSEIWMSSTQLLRGGEDLIDEYHQSDKMAAISVPRLYEDDINEKDFNTSPALPVIQVFTGLGLMRGDSRNRKSTVGNSNNWISHWKLAPHMAALLIYGRLLSCIPQMTCMKLRILVLGTLLFANEFELASNGGDYRRRDHEFLNYCFGSLESSFCIVAGLMIPYASIGLGVGLFFVPIPVCLVAVGCCINEFGNYRRGYGFGLQRRLGAMIFAAAFASFFMLSGKMSNSISFL